MKPTKNIVTDIHELWDYDADSLAMSVKSSVLAKMINDLVKRYPEDTVFTHLDEPVFFIDNSLKSNVLDVMKTFAKGLGKTRGDAFYTQISADMA